MTGSNLLDLEPTPFVLHFLARGGLSLRMYESERRFALEVAAEACRLADSVQREVVAHSDALIKGDRSPVTMADLAIQTVISRRLAQTFPGDALLAEEDNDALSSSPEMAEKVLGLCRTVLPELSAGDMSQALQRGAYEGGGAGRYWVLDPVDGTKGFLRGDHYAIALALIDSGQVKLGVLGCPRLELDPDDPQSPVGSLFVAVAGQGAFSRAVEGGAESPISTDRLSDGSRLRMCESVEKAHAAHDEHAAIAERLGITAEPYRIDSQCKYAVVARGEASIYLRLPSKKGYREKVWDHAAGAIIIEEAGGRVSDLEGRPLNLVSGRFLGKSRGVIATNGVIHDRVLEAAREVTEKPEGHSVSLN